MRISSKRVLGGGEIRPAAIEIENGLIQEVRYSGSRTGGWDCGELLLAPGLVDIHGDAFERQWMPRAHVFFPLDIALLETGRQLLANGITTAYYGLTVSWEPGLRGIEHGRLMTDALSKMRGKLACDTRLHLRFETYAVGEAPELLRWIGQGLVHLIGFNDHLDMIVENLDNEHKAGKYAERSGLSLSAFRELASRVRARSGDVAGTVRQIAEAAAVHGIPIASHDDENPAMRERYRQLGSRICEFPVDAETARSAISEGSHVVLGSPNVVRGGSHTRRMAAVDAIREGLCTVLASDYYYPSMLHSVYRLANEQVLPLWQAWRLVSENAADAARLTDRGVLTPGQRADLIAVDDTDAALPRVVMTMANGIPVYVSDPSLLPVAAETPAF